MNGIAPDIVVHVRSIRLDRHDTADPASARETIAQDITRALSGPQGALLHREPSTGERIGLAIAAHLRDRGSL